MRPNKESKAYVIHTSRR